MAAEGDCARNSQAKEPDLNEIPESHTEYDTEEAIQIKAIHLENLSGLMTGTRLNKRVLILLRREDRKLTVIARSEATKQSSKKMIRGEDD